MLENPKAKGPRSPCECVLSSGSPDIFANRRDVGRTEIRAHLIQVTECKKRGSRCATLSRVRAMTTAAATAVTSTQVITGGEDDRRSFQVIIFSYHEQGSRGGVTHGRGSRRRFVELIRMLYRHLMIEAGGTKAIQTFSTRSDRQQITAPAILRPVVRVAGKTGPAPPTNFPRNSIGQNARDHRHGWVPGFGIEPSVSRW